MPVVSMTDLRTSDSDLSECLNSRTVADAYGIRAELFQQGRTVSTIHTRMVRHAFRIDVDDV